VLRQRLLLQVRVAHQVRQLSGLNTAAVAGALRCFPVLILYSTWLKVSRYFAYVEVMIFVNPVFHFEFVLLQVSVLLLLLLQPQDFPAFVPPEAGDLTTLLLLVPYLIDFNVNTHYHWRKAAPECAATSRH
jgi:hypothetical protein